MSKLGKYDTALNMFVQESSEMNLEYLGFLRWLGERGRLEHPVYGANNGQIVDLMAERERRRGSESNVA